MIPPLRNLLLSAVLIAIPAGGFTLAEMALQPGASPAATQSLGDLSAYRTIVSDTQAILRTGDVAAAEHRMTDLESLWDQNAGRLRQANPAAWGTIDTAADAAFAALRTSTPNRDTIYAALATLDATLAAPPATAPTATVGHVAGIAVTDDTGRALPCEVMIGQLRDALGATTPNARVTDLQARALERCNADDDTNADALAAQAIALIRG